MKTLLVISFFFTFFFVHSQDFDLENISEAEAKAAMRHFNTERNMNTGNYDVMYQRLELTVDPSQPLISGTVTSHYEAKETMNTVVFELVDNMNVSQVTQRGNTLSFTQNSNDEVVIDLPQPQNQGVLDSLSISYSGNPENSGFGSFEASTHDGDPVLWTLSEPFGAKAWWPCKQDLNDKIESIDVYITTPQYNPSNEEYVAVSNGLEMGQTVSGNNKTTHFHHGHPIPAYLVAIAVSNYSVYSHTVANNGNPFEVVNYIYPEDLAYAQSRTPVTVDLINLYADLFEPYPYADEKYGHCQFGWGGGMEHTTISFMGSLSRGLVAHELAHQWFGNKVTCGSWQDVWLNEGFADYLAGLAVKNLDGASSFRNWREQKVYSITSRPDGSVYIPAQDTTSVNRIFSSRLSYDKGAMVLHMLRKKLGDTNFFQGVQDYLDDPDLTYGYAKTPDLIRNMENASGENLTEFFNDWIYGEGYPQYTVQWNQANAGSINVNLSQTQSDASVSFFDAPVPLRLIGTAGETLDVVLDNTVNNENFQPAVGFTVQTVLFDPETDLISKNNTVTLGTESFSLDQQLVLYPNPVQHAIHIQKPESLQVESIKIYNSLGQLLYDEKYFETVDVSKFPKGVLFFQLKMNQSIVNKTVIKR